jgi:predicted phosphoadenosine phosphosulfate sulfurtransferase
MPQRQLEYNVFDGAVSRMCELYSEGHRVVVSVSGGKDSGVSLEVCVLAARMTGRLPVEVVTRDEEIMFPGTFEYLERMAAREEIDFHWLVAGQPIVNLFNRRNPYFWAFDDRLSPEQWVRTPPPFAERIPEQYIQGIVTSARFPPAAGKELYTVVGLRVQESINRQRGIYSSGGYRTGNANKWGSKYARPCYDWTDADVWKAIHDNSWDYNTAYDTMHRMGIPRKDLRISPPTLAIASVPALQMAARAWPQWFNRVATRLEGVRTVAMFGKRAVQPSRRYGETWEECFWRTCVNEAPDWIAERARAFAEHMLAGHTKHASADYPFPQTKKCTRCGGHGYWKALAHQLYMGDPFSMKATSLPCIEPEFFREGAGTWGGGRPTF